MAETLLPHTPTSPALTPNTRTEAEAALSYNALHQTSSAGYPNPGHPARSNSHNYLDAASAAGYPPTSAEPPYPTEATAEQVKGTLSRGTTQAVLQKMESVSAGENMSFEASELGRRVSREGERRTSLIQMTSTSTSTTDGTVDAEGVFGGSGEEAKPTFDRRQSWRSEDLKRLRYEQERLMAEIKAEDGKGFGYESVEASPRR